MPKFYTAIDLNKNSLKNAAIDPQPSSAPSSPSVGQIYFDTNGSNTNTYNRLIIRNAANDTWLNIPYSGNIKNADISSSAAIDVTKLLTSGTNAITLSSIGAPTTSVSLNNQKITNLASPSPSDSSSTAATKGYVDAAVSGLNVHAPANVTSSGSEGYTVTGTAISQISGTTIDTYSVQQNDRILIRNAPADGATGSGSATPTTSLLNGVYSVSSVSGGNINVARANDYNGDIAGEVAAGDYILVLNGSQKGNAYIMSTTGTITVGTTAIAFTQFGQVTNYTAGTGLSLSAGNQFSIDSTVATLTGSQALTNKTVNGLTITSSTGTLTIASGSTLATSGANSITLTSTGATNVTLPTSGTLATVPTGTNQSVATKYRTTVTFSTTSQTVTHNLGTKDVVVQLYDSSDNQVFFDVQTNTTSQVTITNGTNDGLTYRVVVIG